MVTFKWLHFTSAFLLFIYMSSLLKTFFVSLGFINIYLNVPWTLQTYSLIKAFLLGACSVWNASPQIFKWFPSLCKSVFGQIYFLSSGKVSKTTLPKIVPYLSPQSCFISLLSWLTHFYKIIFFSFWQLLSFWKSESLNLNL